MAYMPLKCTSVVALYQCCKITKNWWQWFWLFVRSLPCV